MSLDVQIRVDPTGAVFHRQFTRFTDDVTDLTGAWEQMADEFYGWTGEAFTTQGSSSGSPWAPLSPAYRARKAAQYPGKGILVARENLRRSLTGANAPGSLHRITPTRMELGTDIPYATFHQAGTSRMPARPIIRLTDTQKQRWTQIISRYLAQRAGRYMGDL